MSCSGNIIGVNGERTAQLTANPWSMSIEPKGGCSSPIFLMKHPDMTPIDFAPYCWYDLFTRLCDLDNAPKFIRSGAVTVDVLRIEITVFRHKCATNMTARLVSSAHKDESCKFYVGNRTNGELFFVPSPCGRWECVSQLTYTTLPSVNILFVHADLSHDGEPMNGYLLDVNMQPSTYLQAFIQCPLFQGQLVHSYCGTMLALRPSAPFDKH